MLKKTLYVSISAHGYGHIGQMAPVLNKLALEQGHQIEFIIQSEAPERFLTNTFHFDFRHIPKAADIGMLMSNSLDVQPQQSHRAYRDFHERWAKELLLKSREIDRLKPDLVLSNISYLTLAAAKHLSLPAIGLCSLNWADIYRGYCGALPGADEVYEQAKAHYQGADRFLVPTPGMPMDDLSNRRVIGPLSRLGNRYPGFRESLGLTADHQLVLVSMGGIAHQLSSELWPDVDGVVWLDAGNSPSPRRDIIPLNQINLPFIDVLAQCDLLISKPGYGMFTEATCNGIPVLYVRREQWPEEPYLVDWLKRHNRCAELNREAFYQGDFRKATAALLQSAGESERAPVSPTGVGEACGFILEGLGLV